MLTIRQGVLLSAIIDKMDLKITNPKGTQSEVGADLIMQFVRRLHIADDEITTFVADVRKVSQEEAQQTDIVEFITDLLAKHPRLLSFFTSAVKRADLE